MRTALFNWLWARHNQGRFVLRIDDTDQQRNLEEALQPILEAFRWLGLDWDEGPEVGGPHAPYFQSQRGGLYGDAIGRLLAEGQAFRDFDSSEQVQADREAAEKEKRSYLNVRRSLDLSPSQIEQFLAEGRPHVVRLLVPRDQTVVIDDAVRGRVEWDCALMPDPVLLRSDGSPLYNFATAVDDAQMQISHVIRAEEHLSNTPVQVLIHQALGNTLPQFAHVPYVAAPGSKEKLSKRKLEKYRHHGQFRKMFEQADTVFPRIGLTHSQSLSPVMVEYYERIGYLPAAILNALARLGWSLDDKTEILPLSTVVEHFTLERIVKSPAGYDPDKLMSFQAHWMNQLPLAAKTAGCLPYLIRAGYVPETACFKKVSGTVVQSTLRAVPATVPDTFLKHVPETADQEMRDYVGRVISAMGDRLKVFSDVLDYDEFFVADDRLTYDEKSVEKRLRKSPESVELLRAFRERLETVEPYDSETLDRSLHEFVDSRGAKIGSVIHALRVAVTGKSVGIGMFDCLAILGRDRCLTRIDRALQLAEEKGTGTFCSEDSAK